MLTRKDLGPIVNPPSISELQDKRHVTKGRCLRIFKYKSGKVRKEELLKRRKTAR
jgi:hypothetical protein